MRSGGGGRGEWREEGGEREEGGRGKIEEQREGRKGERRGKGGGEGKEGKKVKSKSHHTDASGHMTCTAWYKQ